jgi:predicted ribosomally synthesized peptide with nif11-like leader
MSTEDIDALMRSARNDRALANELRQAGGLAKLVQIGAQRGCEFTEEELEAYFERLPSEELSEQELESVAAGAGDAGEQVYFTIKLERCLIRSWSTTGDGG